MVEYTSDCVQPANVLGIIYGELKGKEMAAIQGCESKPSSLDFDRSIISWQYSMLQKNGSTVPKFDKIFMDQIISTALCIKCKDDDCEAESEDNEREPHIFQT
jgi:UDP-glucose 6-dehydrogenase